MTMRVSFFFKQDTFGWTESLYSSADSQETALTQAGSLAVLRRQFLPSAARIAYIRASDPDLRGDVRVSFPNLIGTATWPEGPNWPWNGILVRLQTFATGINGRVFTRPAPEVEGSGTTPTSNIPTFWMAQSAPWRAALADVGSPWEVRGLDSADQPIGLKGSVVVVSGGLMSFSTFAPTDFAVGDRIRIGRTKPLTPNCHGNVNGVYRINEVLSSTEFTVLTGLPAQSTVPNVGQVRRLTPEYVPITQAIVERYVSHRTGRPFDSPRGRQSRSRVC